MCFHILYSHPCLPSFMPFHFVISRLTLSCYSKVDPAFVVTSFLQYSANLPSMTTHISPVHGAYIVFIEHTTCDYAYGKGLHRSVGGVLHSICAVASLIPKPRSRSFTFRHRSQLCHKTNDFDI